MRAAAAACWMVAGIGYLILEAAAAAGFGLHYGYAVNMISDLGRPDLNPSADLMNAAFYLQGTLFLVAAILISRAESSRSTTPFIALAVANAIGNIAVGTIHSSSWLHVAGAVLAITGGNAAILAGLPIVDDIGWYRVASRVLAAVGLIAFAALAVQTLSASVDIAPDAALERVSVYTIIVWQMLSAVRVSR